MKNTLIKIFVIALCFMSFNSQAQVSPVDKEMAKRLEQERIYAKKKEMANQMAKEKAKEKEQLKENEKKEFNFIELVVFNFDGEYKVEEQEFEFESFTKNKDVKVKLETILKLPEYLTKEKVNLASFLGKKNIKIISHSFISIERGEKHIYILEL